MVLPGSKKSQVNGCSPCWCQ